MRKYNIRQGPMKDINGNKITISKGDTLSFVKASSELYLIRKDTPVDWNLITGDVLQFAGFLKTIYDFQAFCIILGQLTGLRTDFTHTQTCMHCIFF